MYIVNNRFDIYRKIPKDLTQPTNTGATISIGCVLFILFLLISEFLAFIEPEVASQLFVHNSAGISASKIPVVLDISVFNIPCRCKFFEIIKMRIIIKFKN